jgi:hypothetical protein
MKIMEMVTVYSLNQTIHINAFCEQTENNFNADHALYRLLKRLRAFSGYSTDLNEQISPSQHTMYVQKSVPTEMRARQCLGGRSTIRASCLT